MPQEVDLLAHLNRVIERQPPELQFVARTPEEWRSWRGAALARLPELLTFDRIARYTWQDPPPATVSEQVEGDGFSRERVLIPTLDGLWLPCFALIPNSPPPHPAVLCLHGHGMSKHILAGAPRDAKEKELTEKLRGDYAQRFAQAGFLALAPDAAGYGERQEEAGCPELFRTALALGLSLQGIRVWEILRALDYLAARPDVEADRIAAAGLSMGCEHSMYVTALDERVRGAVLSCCVRALLDETVISAWCPCLLAPGLFAAMDWPDITALIAPRPVQLQFGDRDYVPIDLAREAHARLQRAYELAAAPPGSLEYDEFSGKHEFHFDAALPFIQRCLA